MEEEGGAGVGVCGEEVEFVVVEVVEEAGGEAKVGEGGEGGEGGYEDVELGGER